MSIAKTLTTGGIVPGDNLEGMLEGRIEGVAEMEMGNLILREDGITEMTGLELVRKDGGFIFVPHTYIGKEPDTKFLYNQKRKIAELLGIQVNAASWICSDEENGLERAKRSFYQSKVFADGGIGPQVLSQPTHVGGAKGHSSNVFLFFGHIGMYKNNGDGRILLGGVESERDGVSRPTCGALHHTMNRFLGKEYAPEKIEEWDVDLIGKLEQSLKPFGKGIVEAYNSGSDELEKHSLGMQYMVSKHVDVQTHRLIKLIESRSHDTNHNINLVFGAITINRIKYPDTSLLTHAYLLKDGKSYNLTETIIPNAARH